ncbi:MAG: YegS/Rv2252/BmrU family lipid kinase [Acidobacteria bacterium]|nr:YegS/Rv2252/BmrU family lipid kinase [Acidobacteriota bacterium]
MNDRYLAVINPAAGGGKCGKLASAVLENLRSHGIKVDAVETRHAGHGTELARHAYQQGCRQFLAVGGDGTSYEIVNGLFPQAQTNGRPALGFLPLGTGNSFLRDFTDRGPDYSIEAILAGHRRACDVLRMTHKQGVIHYINLLSMGFTADVASLTNRRCKSLGEFGYLLAVLICLARLRRRAFPLRADGDTEPDQRRCLFLTFNNSKFTGGKMMIAPKAETGDGLIELVRWGTIGRIGLLRNLHTLYDGTHVNHPLASRRAVRCVEFELEGAVDVMVDGEVLALKCERLDILPGALDVIA